MGYVGFYWSNIRIIITVHKLYAFLRIAFASTGFLRIFALRNGALAEWLGAGLQNLSQWFDSATHLQKCLYSYL